jgi:gamma-glutamyltranspeptidase/glutathione hydrolase
MNRGKGLINRLDLAQYKPVFRPPLKGRFEGYDVITMPPPSSGGLILLQMLAMIEPSRLKQQGFGSSEGIHSMVEVMKRCFADRAIWMADPDFFRVPVKQLLDPSYLKSRKATINEQATPSESIRSGIQMPNEHQETTHFSIVDPDGNAVSNTYTLNGGYGSGVTVTGAGFLLNNEMDDFAAKPGMPNMLGLVQGEQNAIQPRKRPLSSMTPTILVKNGKVAMVVGSPGGPTIINTVFEAVLNHTLFQMSAQAAVSAPRFHHQWIPDEIVFERFGLSKDVADALQTRGHKIRMKSSQGSCHVIAIDPKTGLRNVGCDRRLSTAGFAGF